MALLALAPTSQMLKLPRNCLRVSTSASALLHKTRSQQAAATRC